MKKEKLIEMVNILLQSELEEDVAHDYKVKDMHLKRDKNGRPCKLVLDFDTNFSMPLPRGIY